MKTAGVPIRHYGRGICFHTVNMQLCLCFYVPARVKNYLRKEHYSSHCKILLLVSMIEE